MKKEELHSEAIAGLVDYFGGYSLVAAILNVKIDDLRDWAEGRRRPPSNVSCRMMHLAGDMDAGFSRPD